MTPMRTLQALAISCFFSLAVMTFSFFFDFRSQVDGMDPCIKKKRGSLFPKGETGSLSLTKKASQSSRLRAADCIFLEKAALPLFRPSHAIASPE